MPPVAAPRMTVAVVALATVLAAPAAQAQLTADAVWQSWQAYSAVAGQTVQASSVNRDGATLTVSGVRIDTPADDVSASMEIETIAFTEQADGTVSVTMSDAYDMRLIGDAGETIVLNMRHPGLRLIVAEGEGALIHSITAPEVTFSLGEFIAPAGSPDVMNMQVTALGVTGTYGVPTVPGGPADTDLGIGAVNFGLEIRDASGEHVSMDYAVTGLSLGFASAGLDQLARMEEGDLAGALADGLSIGFALGYDTVRYAFDIDADGSQAVGAGSSMNGETRFAMNARELSFRSSNRNMEFVLSGSDVPLPQVAVKAAELGYGFSLPTSGAPTPQPAGLLVRLVDLVLPDDVWAMADPAGQIPRGPASVVLDLAAELMLPSDLFGMETMFGYMMGGPFEAAQPVSLQVNALQLRVAGAELTGDGSFTFDPTDTETFPGMPRPAGVLNLALRGGTQLLDTLVGMGMIPQDQAQGARMMLALFARPGATPDELVSKLELRDDGSIFANDMRIQ